MFAQALGHLALSDFPAVGINSAPGFLFLSAEAFNNSLPCKEGDIRFDE
jgi:hypothetical protein